LKILFFFLQKNRKFNKQEINFKKKKVKFENIEKFFDKVSFLILVNSGIFYWVKYFFFDCYKGKKNFFFEIIK
jgi:hypothetical protein